MLNRSHTVVSRTPVKVLTAPSGSVRTSAVIGGLRSGPGLESPLSSIWEDSYDSMENKHSVPLSVLEQSGYRWRLVSRRLVV